MTKELVEELPAITEAICAEKCAQAGDPPCSQVCSEPHCEECVGIAMRMRETFLPILARQRNEGIEAAARVVEKNAEVRFEEHGTREWDTNACYYEGAAGETYEALDEECEAIATAIRALKEPE